MMHAAMNTSQTLKDRLDTDDAPVQKGADYGVLVNSIGSAGASIISALKLASSMPEQILAFRLFQAPSLLFKNLSLDIASEAVRVLKGAGVECEVRHKDEPFVAGDSDHEVALVIHEIDKMSALLESVMRLLGVSVGQAKQMICNTPAVLVGRISAATTEALKRRFAPLGVELDVSRSQEDVFDAFIGETTPAIRAQAKQLAMTQQIQVFSGNESGPVFAMNMTREEAERLFAATNRAKYPISVVNRSFQRFDVRLERAMPSPELTALLVETAKMPERIVPKVLARLPIITHSNVSSSRMQEIVQGITELGGVASGQLLSFQTFGLTIDKVGDAPVSSMILRGIGGLSKESAENALSRTHRVDGPLTSTLARWLQHELKQAGTSSKVVAR
jgi:ribosomal protein L7/L12